MYNIIDEILLEVCLDDRIEDGIFRIENEYHLNILREYLLKFGINESSVNKIHSTLIEGRFPERQAYNKDGLLVTFPTPKHKQNAISRGTHFDVNPHNKSQIASKPSAPKPPEQPQTQPQVQPSAQSQAHPKTQPQAQQPQDTVSKDEPDAQTPTPTEEPPKTDAEPETPGAELFTNTNVVYQNGVPLKVSPPKGDESPESPYPKEPAPKTQLSPERKEAEKQVAKSIINTNDTDVVFPAITEQCLKELNVLKVYADINDLKDAKEFLSKLTK